MFSYSVSKGPSLSVYFKARNTRARLPGTGLLRLCHRRLVSTEEIFEARVLNLGTHLTTKFTHVSRTRLQRPFKAFQHQHTNNANLTRQRAVNHFQNPNQRPRKDRISPLRSPRQVTDTHRGSPSLSSLKSIAFILIYCRPYNQPLVSSDLRSPSRNTTQFTSLHSASMPTTTLQASAGGVTFVQAQDAEKSTLHGTPDLLEDFFAVDYSITPSLLDAVDHEQDSMMWPQARSNSSCNIEGFPCYNDGLQTSSELSVQSYDDFTSLLEFSTTDSQLPTSASSSPAFDKLLSGPSSMTSLYLSSFPSIEDEIAFMGHADELFSSFPQSMIDPLSQTHPPQPILDPSHATQWKTAPWLHQEEDALHSRNGPSTEIQCLTFQPYEPEPQGVPTFVPPLEESHHVSPSSSSPSLPPTDLQDYGTLNPDGTWRCAYPSCTSRVLFTRGCDLRKHYKRHAKTLFCRHQGCPQSTNGGFSSKKDRARHEAKHDPDVKCERRGCGRVFSRVDNMRDHVRRVHRRGAGI